VSVVDPDQFNKKKETFDPKATKSKPIWFCAEVSFVKKFSRPIALDELRADPRLKEMVLLRRGSRLSVQPVSKLEFRAILDTAERSDSSSHRPNDQL